MQVHTLLVSIFGFLAVSLCWSLIAAEANHEENLLQIFGHKIRILRSVTYHNRNHEHSHRRHRKQNGSEPIPQCPPPMTRLPDDACTVDPCQSDFDCTLSGQKCCYNGCLYACVHIVRPPPLIDWRTRSSETNNIDRSERLEERNEYEGNIEFDIMPGNMLIESHRGDIIGEMCSTTVEDGETPTECPHGYECHIEDQGNPLEGTPNRGSCIAINENAPEDLSDLENGYIYY